MYITTSDTPGAGCGGGGWRTLRDGREVDVLELVRAAADPKPLLEAELGQLARLRGRGAVSLVCRRKAAWSGRDGAGTCAGMKPTNSSGVRSVSTTQDAPTRGAITPAASAAAQPISSRHAARHLRLQESMLSSSCNEAVSVRAIGSGYEHFGRIRLSRAGPRGRRSARDNEAWRRGGPAGT